MIIEANAQSDKLFIFDARPEVNAKVNKVHKLLRLIRDSSVLLDKST